MPVGNQSAEDLASSDEIKVFKFEGEDEKRASADLTDLKSSLITETTVSTSSLPSTTSLSATSSTILNDSINNRIITNGGGLLQSPSSSPINRATEFGGKFEPTTLHQYSPFGYPPFGNTHSPYHPHNGTTLGQMVGVFNFFFRFVFKRFQFLIIWSFQ
uniref:Uncharacterized protein LOC113798220 n=1 Tax=Dermatophagoides pteronyssinus TaxID=6956 RepID=A0A6P6YI42_DERPT|nr:uncharacterized protein LOC113798220 [Dermatophagoides pteronyssinus]